MIYGVIADLARRPSPSRQWQVSVLPESDRRTVVGIAQHNFRSLTLPFSFISLALAARNLVIITKSCKYANKNVDLWLNGALKLGVDISISLGDSWGIQNANIVQGIWPYGGEFQTEVMDFDFWCAKAQILATKHWSFLVD